jgi:hypothetical protein
MHAQTTGPISTKFGMQVALGKLETIALKKPKNIN